MWDGLPMLLLLSFVMAGASFLAGLLPLSLQLSSRQLRLVTALGTGVLVGTSLIVIIPEGIETLYSAGGSDHGHVERSVDIVHRHTPLFETVLSSHQEQQWRRGLASAALETDNPDDGLTGFRTGPDDGFQMAEDTVPAASASPEDDPVDPNPDASPGDSDLGADEGAHVDRDPHAWVGVSLIAGFILMYLIDTLPRHATTRSQPQRFAISLNQFSLTRSPSMPSDPDPETPSHSTFPSATSSRPSSTTIGLVIHAAADGIALGASTTTPRLTFIIFLALMIHKAPAAFGLTAVLLKQNLSKRAARAHLIVFSLAAPVGALLTWSAAHMLGYSGGANTEFATGVLLLFSGGTFLYVAMHTMQEAGGGHAHEHGVQENGYAGVPAHDLYDQPGSAGPPKSETPGLVETLVTVVGMGLPLLTQLGHGH